MIKIQVVTIEFWESKKVRIMLEKTSENLFRAYLSLNHNGQFTPFGYTGIEGPSPKLLFERCVATVKSLNCCGPIIRADNQVTGILSSKEADNQVAGILPTEEVVAVLGINAVYEI